MLRRNFLNLGVLAVNSIPVVTTRSAHTEKGKTQIKLTTLVATATFFVVAEPLPSIALDEDLVEELRLGFREAATRADLGEAIQALSTFGGTPGISSASFNVAGIGNGDDLDHTTSKIAPSHTFGPIFGFKPYGEITLGYLNSKQTLNFDAGTVANVNIETMSVLGGIGIDFDIAEGMVFRPIVLAGHAWSGDNTHIRGPFAEEFETAGDGIVFDVALNSSILGGAIVLEYDGTFAGDIRFNSQLRYNYLFQRVVSASDKVLETEGDFGVLTALVEFDGPMDAKLFGRNLRWIGFVSNTYLSDNTSDALGFSLFFELGGGIELVDMNVVSGIEGISILASAIVGDNVVGWKSGLSLEF